MIFIYFLEVHEQIFREKLLSSDKIANCFYKDLKKNYYNRFPKG